MFTRVTRSGGRAYLQLVEAFRNEDGQPRQRVVANLGRLDQLSAKDLAPLIEGLSRAVGREAPAAAVFESSRAFGDLYALHALWGELGLDRAVRTAVRSSRRQFDAAALIRILVFNRLCDPASKLGVLRWLETVALPEAPASVSHDHLLRSMDALMDRVEAVQAAVARQLRPLLDASVSVVFYDLTTIRIHGEGDVADDVRAFGLSKDTGGIARQFVLGVIQTADGLPIAHEVHVGNVGEVATLLPAIRSVMARYSLAKIVLVADRGLLSLDNLEAVEALKGVDGPSIEYILAVPARRYGEFADLVAKTRLRDGLGEARWNERRVVIAHDEAAAQRQRAARREALARIEAEGERLAKRLDAAEEGTPKRGRPSTDRRAYLRFCELVSDARLGRILKADLNAERFSFDRDEAALEAAEQLDGKLLLVTNTGLPTQDVLTRYKALADIERGFRVLKSDIAIAPVHHRLPERIRAHALICFLALVLHRILRARLRASGSALSPQRALATLRQIQRHQVRLDANTLHGISRITEEQLDILRTLKLPKPEAKTAA